MKIKNLVFEGGGVKGIAYAGALQVLQQKKLLEEVENVAGTSAGAITACLLSLRLSPETITHTIMNMDLGDFEDHENLFKKFRDYGLHSGDTFLSWIKKQIVGAGRNLTAKATFSDFHQANCRNLKVYATDIYSHSIQEFSYKNTPTTVVAEAVRASMSIPLFFNAWQFSNHTPNDHLFVDGGMVYNYPIEAFDQGQQPNPDTLGFRLKDVHARKEPNKFGYGHWIHYVKNTFETLLKAQSIQFNKDVENKERTIIIDDLGVLATDFNISKSIKEKLLQSGKDAVIQHFNSDYLS